MTKTNIIHKDQDFIIRREKSSDDQAIETLLDQAFGAERHNKTTYLFRQGTDQIDALSFVAINREGQLVGTIRFWPVTTDEGKPVLLLGPLAVDEGFTGHKCGLALMEVGIEYARNLGEDLIILVGDEVYYGKVGFATAPVDHFQFPGPVEPERVLYLELSPSALDKASGKLSPFKA